MNYIYIMIFSSDNDGAAVFFSKLFSVIIINNNNNNNNKIAFANRDNEFRLNEYIVFAAV